MIRKPIQMVVIDDVINNRVCQKLVVLCDDGSMWLSQQFEPTWLRIDSIPQD